MEKSPVAGFAQELRVSPVEGVSCGPCYEARVQCDIILIYYGS
jgi:hypothetical protein